MLNPLGQLLKTIFTTLLGQVYPEIPEITLDYAEILKPVAHIHPPEPIFGVGGLAHHGWTTLRRIVNNHPAITSSHYQNDYSKRQIMHVKELIGSIADDIENLSPLDFSIPLPRIEMLRDNGRYIMAIADSYREHGTTVRLHERSGAVDMTNVRDVFSGNAARANKAAGVEIAHVLSNFFAGVNNLCYEASSGVPKVAPPETPQHRMGPPSPLRNRRAPHND